MKDLSRSGLLLLCVLRVACLDITLKGGVHNRNGSRALRFQPRVKSAGSNLLFLRGRRQGLGRPFLLEREPMWGAGVGIEDPIKQYDETKLAPVWQVFWPTLWLCVMASVRLFESRSRWGNILGRAMWLVLFGGFYIFTAHIKFRSIHWDPPRTLSGIECMYFMSVTLTTVGYGDIVPHTGVGKLCVALYILGSLFAVSILFTQALKNAIHRITGFEACVGHTPAKKAAILYSSRHDEPSSWPVIISLGPLLVFIVGWTLIFHIYYDERKSLLNALYNALISFSTVGFGAFVPLSQGGMVMDSWTLIFGTLGLGNALSCLCTWVSDLKTYAKFQERAAKNTPALLVEKLMLLSNDGFVSETEFILASLLNTDVIGLQEVRDVKTAWQLVGSKSGSVSVAELRKALISELHEPVF